MDRTALKKYAPQARREFIAAITDRAGLYGLTKKKSEPVTFQGDVALIGGRPHPARVGRLQQRLAARIARDGFDTVMEAVSYTWFNRFAAIRYMELHGYLDHGYRVLSHPEGRDAPEILEHAEHVELPGLNRTRVIDLKLAGNQDNELYRMLLVAQCNALSTAMPFLFERIDDETELLLPENLLHSDSLLRKLVRDIPEENWQEIEVLGWLYQFYISEKKDQVIGKVVKTEDIPAATQLFTPNWIVKYLVQNSIGRKWLEAYPESALRGNMAYYVEEVASRQSPVASEKEVVSDQWLVTSKEEEAASHQSLSTIHYPLSTSHYPLSPESLTLLDPACGSGHILVEAYDLFKAMYRERGYRAKDIPRLILANNLFGLEIDARAAQLASFALCMKARADDRNVLQGGIRMNIRCIQSSDGLKAEEVYEALTGVDVLDKSGLPPADDFFEEDTAPLFAHLRNQVAMGEGPGTRGQGLAPSPSSLVPSSPLSPDPCPLTPSSIRELLSLFKGDAAHTFGSLIRIPGELAKLLPDLVERTDRLVHGNDLTRQWVAERFAPIAEQAWLLGRRYDAVVANPPYMGSKGMNPALKEFASKAYPEGKSDLFSMFLVRGGELAAPTGFNAMITMQSWMFLSSYEKLREHLLATTTIVTMAHFGAQAFDTIGGAVVQTTASVLWNTHRENYPGGFIRLTEGANEAEKEAALRTVCASLSSSLTTTDQRLATSSPFSLAPSPSSLVPNSSLAPSPYLLIPNIHRAAAEDFKKIPGSPIAYWVSEKIFKIFSVCDSLIDHCESGGRIKTHNNDRYMRHHWEVDRSITNSRQPTWILYENGGVALKWYGNVVNVVCWNPEAKAYYQSHGGLTNEKYWRREGITWNNIGSPGFRLKTTQTEYSSVSPTAFPCDNSYLNYILGFLNTKFSFNLIKIINPSLSNTIGDILRLPLIVDGTNLHTVNKLVNTCVEISRTDWNSYETSWDFTTLPLLRPEHHHPKLSYTYAHLRAHWMEMTLEMQRLEEENNRLFIEAYGLEEELTPEVPLEEITLTCNPYYRFKEVASRESLVVREEEEGEEVVSRESLVVSEEEMASDQWLVARGEEEVVSRESLVVREEGVKGFPVNEALEGRLLTETMKELVSYAVGCMMGRYSLDEPGLIYAHSGNEGFDFTRYKTFPVDDDGIVPVTEAGWFEDDAAERFFKFVGVRGEEVASEEEVVSRQSLVVSEEDKVAAGAAPKAAGDSTLTTNNYRLTTNSTTDLDFIADALGRKKDETSRDTIRRYFATGFFKDHLQTYKRRPIYWLFTSGRLRAFQCLVYLHRYNEGTLARMRTEYVIPLQGKMAARMEHLDGDIVAAGTTSQRKKHERERDLLRKQLEELRTFDEQLRHYADMRIALDLDDGVKVNYGKFGNLLADVRAVTGGTGE